MTREETTKVQATKDIFEGINVREERERRGMSQQELSEKSGVPQTVLSRIENGHVSPRAKTLFAIRQALGDTSNSLDTMIEFEDLRTGIIRYYDRQFFELYGARHVCYVECRAMRNEPYILMGDMLYFDKDIGICSADKCFCNLPDGGCNMSGYYLFKFKSDYACALVQRSLQDKNMVHLSFANAHYPDLGWQEISDLNCHGKLIRLGRTASNMAKAFAY